MTDAVNVGGELLVQIPRGWLEASAVGRYQLYAEEKLDLAGAARFGGFWNTGGHGFERGNRSDFGPLLGLGLMLGYLVSNENVATASLELPLGFGLDRGALHAPLLVSIGFDHQIHPSTNDAGQVLSSWHTFGKPVSIGFVAQAGPFVVTNPSHTFLYWSVALRLTHGL